MRAWLALLCLPTVFLIALLLLISSSRLSDGSTLVLFCRDMVSQCNTTKLSGWPHGRHMTKLNRKPHPAASPRLDSCRPGSFKRHLKNLFFFLPCEVLDRKKAMEFHGLCLPRTNGILSSPPVPASKISFVKFQSTTQTHQSSLATTRILHSVPCLRLSASSRCQGNFF